MEEALCEGQEILRLIFQKTWEENGHTFFFNLIQTSQIRFFVSFLSLFSPNNFRID